jgi:hypothetical protein
MSTVNEWAKREAENRLSGDFGPHGALARVSFVAGADTLAALLLSDEAVQAAIVSIRGMGPDTLDREPAESWEVADARRILQAALTKITEDK